MSTALPGTEAVVKERVLARLREAGREGLWPEEIRKDIGGGATVAQVRNALQELQAAGKAFELDELWHGEGSAKVAVGVVEVLESGDALFRPAGVKEPEHLILRTNRKGALTGDTVLVKRLNLPIREGEWRHLTEARVERILHERLQTLVGTLDEDRLGRRWLVPYDPRLPLELLVEDAGNVPPDWFVVVQVERRPRVVGRVVEVLGHPQTPGVDVQVVLHHYGIPDEFPAEVLAQAERFPPDPGPKDWRGREDLRDRVVVTIDGESARDFDDAVSIERVGDGVYRLGVHIADVASYVEEGSALDMEAYRRGTSVYYPDRAIPMLPEALSNGLCSLRPRVPRLTVSVFLDIDAQGKVLDRRFAETVIRSSRRMTYTEVRRILEEPQERDIAEYGPVLNTLRDMHALMKILNAARTERGSIDFDLPEGNVELGTDGTVVGVIPAERNVAHRLIEELMIAANEAVAYELDTRGVPALYRVHDAPSPDRLAELREVLRPLGVPLKGELSTLHPAALRQVLKRVEGKPEEAFVSFLVLRTMQRALYDPVCHGHYALASHYYCHFTSPIRRYPDLVVHRGLKALIHGEAEKRAADSALEARLPSLAEHTSAMERRAEQSERDLLQWKKVRFLADRVGETFQGRITGVQPFGIFVQLDTYLVDGLVPVWSMGDDYYVYEAETHRLVGEQRRQVFQLAGGLEVKLIGVSLRHRSLDLRIVGMPEPLERKERSGPSAKKKDDHGRRGRDDKRGRGPARGKDHKGGGAKKGRR